MSTLTTTPSPTSRPVPVLPPLHVGRHVIESPVVLAPMAGITNRAFRRLCREYGSAGLEAGGASGATSLYVAEMVTSRALVERTPETMRLISHDPGEHPRSVQLYSVDPATAGRAARMLVTEDRADHIDLNFGCPVPKVTRKGGGAALPWKTDLFRAIVAAVVREAAQYEVPVTVKMRVGIDADHVTYLDAGRIAEREGAAAVALHGRTAAQAYSGTADWDAVARLKDAVTTIPVLGNGDIWSAEDALEMVRRTGVDGVVVGRGCLGRPWLFTDLAAAFTGSDARVRPGLREVTDTLRRHAEYLVEFYDGDEQRGCRDIRKHIAWYLKGFPAGSTVRNQLALVDSLAALDDLIATMDLDHPWPGEPAEGPRGRAGSPRVVALPENWLRSRELDPAQQEQVAQAEISVSGGEVAGRALHSLVDRRCRPKPPFGRREISGSPRCSMKSRLSSLAAAAALVVTGSVVTAQPAAADEPCTVSSYTPRVMEVGLSKVRKLFKVRTSGCASVSYWSIFIEGDPGNGQVGLQYLRHSSPYATLYPGFFYNSDAGFRWDAEVDVHNADDVSTVRTFAESFVVKRRVAISLFDAGPSPVATGRPIAIKGLLRSANWDQGRYTPLRFASVRVQFRQSTHDSWSNVKTVKSSSTGWVNTTVTASEDGYWRLYYPGGTRFGARGVYQHFVDVR